MTARDEHSSSADYFGDNTPVVSYNRVWFNIMRAQRKFLPRIAKALKTCGINDPIWYEILLEVELSGPGGQPMAALEDKLFVAQYALSRHISRMEKAGLLRREFIADGRRKQILFLTEQGKGMHARIWPVYWDAMQDEIGPHMTTDEAYTLSRLLIKLLP
jgi:DNA-binding MarR family transcriptional regulator